MSYEIKWQPRGVYKRFSGGVSAGEFFASIAEVQNNPDFDRLKFSVNNFLDVTSYGISLEDVTAFAALGLGAQFSNPGLVIAIVATNDSILSLIRDHYEPITKYKMAYFQSDAEAVAWLKEQTHLDITF